MFFKYTFVESMRKYNNALVLIINSDNYFKASLHEMILSKEGIKINTRSALHALLQKVRRLLCYGTTDTTFHSF